MVEHQGPRRRAVCEIEVDGQSITHKLNPYLISVQVIDSTEGAHSTCNIELDDRNGELQIPPDGVTLAVYLGWAGEGPRVPDTGRVWADYTGGTHGHAAEISVQQAFHERKWGGPGIRQVFFGQVSSVESGFGRKGGGRRLWIEATSGNVKGVSKETLTKSWGEGLKTDKPEEIAKLPDILLSTVMEEVFGAVGLKVKLSPEMAKKVAKHWFINNESPQMFGQRLAKDLGGIFKIDNNVASLVGAMEGVNADGDAMPELQAVWGVNLIGWRIKPMVGRPQYGAAATRFFNLHTAQWDNVIETIAGDNAFYSMANAVINTAMPAATKDEASANNAGNSANVQSRRGTGWVLINGDPTAEANAFITILDARPGIDARYFISEAEHNYTRGVGYTTRCNIKNPTPFYEPGRDWTRKPGKYDSKLPMQYDDPNAPNYIEPQHTDPSLDSYRPPSHDRSPTPYTEADKEGFRKWYRDHQKPLPKWLLPKAS